MKPSDLRDLNSRSRGLGSSPGESLCCVIGGNTLFSIYLALPRIVIEWRQTVGGT